MTGHIQKKSWGEHAGQEVFLFTLASEGSLTMRATNYGATLMALEILDTDGRPVDVVLGFERPDEYFGEHPFFGSVVGRMANRIARGRFMLEGQPYQLTTNDGPDHLHGGPRGFHRVVWESDTALTADGPSVTFRYRSADGDAGYPGEVDACVTYQLVGKSELHVTMTATTSRTTIVNLAQHAYFNLGGVGRGDVLDHELTLYASQYTPGAPVVPDGRVQQVADTPFDFTRPKRLGRDLLAAGGTPVGFDHNYVVDGPEHTLRPVAQLVHPPTGRALRLEANQPGVQLYTGNFLDGSLRGKGATYQKHTGVCLETQAFPNAINVPAWQNQVLLEPGQTYDHRMVLRFDM